MRQIMNRMDRALKVSFIIFFIIVSTSIVAFTAQWAFSVTMSINNLHERVKQLESHALQK